MKNLILTILYLLITPGYIVAQSLHNNIDLDDLIVQVDDNPRAKLTKKLIINKSFSNIEQVAATVLNATNLQVVIRNQSADRVSKVKIIQSEGTIASFLDTACRKFHYSWKWLDDIIVLTAKTPASVNLPVIKNSLAPQTPSVTWVIDVHDKTLRSAFTKWCKQSGWQLVWNIKADYPITNFWRVGGTFEHAINEVLKSSQNTDTPLFATMHDSNKVLEIHSQVTNK